jgi:hypothetical protein
MADETDDTKKDEKVNAARRRLLKSAIYVPPAVIGMVSLLDGCAPASCNPATCNPQNMCHPNQSCNPHP